MPLAIDIFNKKVLANSSNFGTFNVLLSGDVSGSQPSTPQIITPIQLNTSAEIINISGNLSSSFYGTLTGSKQFTYSNFQTGQYINLYLKANHTGNGVEHTFPSGTLFDKYGNENKIYTHSGYITHVELLNHPYGYLGTSHLIKHYEVFSGITTGQPTGQPTGVLTDPYSDYVTLLMHFNTTGIDPFPTGALAFWKLSDLTDSTPNGNDFTNNGGVQFVSGKIGDCAEFNGSNHLETPMAVNWTSDFSISMWVNPSNTPGYQVMFYGGAAQTMAINYVGNNTLDVNNGQSANINVPFSPSVWSHIVVTKNSSETVCWINGASIATGSVQSHVDNNTVRLGMSQGMQYYNGEIDAVGVWNRVLTNEEIQQLYNNGNGLEP